mmetsp:Transcript_11618/g.20572  ORF Transcript_11618/g.20572 Transcript_11618/m.20572 type:complete len:201 (-) Transcript_11618:276-878(-)
MGMMQLLGECVVTALETVVEVCTVAVESNSATVQTSRYLQERVAALTCLAQPHQAAQPQRLREPLPLPAELQLLCRCRRQLQCRAQRRWQVAWLQERKTSVAMMPSVQERVHSYQQALGLVERAIFVIAVQQPVPPQPWQPQQQQQPLQLQEGRAACQHLACHRMEPLLPIVLNVQLAISGGLATQTRPSAPAQVVPCLS